MGDHRNKYWYSYESSKNVLVAGKIAAVSPLILYKTLLDSYLTI